MSKSNADTVVFLEKLVSNLHSEVADLKLKLGSLDRCKASDLKHISMIDLLKIISAREEEIETVRKLIRRGGSS